MGDSIASLKRRVVRVAGAAGVLLLGLAGCETTTEAGPGSEVATLAAAVRKWEATAPPSYVYTLEKLCYCAFTTPLRVTVRAGVVESAQVISTGVFLTVAELDWVPTIPEVFAALAYALGLPAASFDARYDSARGFPTEASIDHSVQIADDEVTYRLRDFAAIP